MVHFRLLMDAPTDQSSFNANRTGAFIRITLSLPKSIGPYNINSAFCEYRIQRLQLRHLKSLIIRLS